MKMTTIVRQKILNVQGLNKSYGKLHVLKDISFHIEEGEIVGFVGPNGSGKSTTMKCIMNLTIPDSGEISIYGYDIKKNLKQALTHVSAQIEYPGLYLSLSGLDNLKYFALLRNIPKGKIDEVIDFIGIEDSIKRMVSTYSMGMKQRLALGIALLSDPKLLILDEPTNGLDPNAVFELRELLLSLKKKGISILFSSHQLSEVEKIADRILFINKGNLIEADLLKDPKVSYELEVNDNSRLIALLSNSPIEHKINELTGRVIVTLPNKSFLQKIISFLNGNQIEIIDISKSSSDIETIYEGVFGERL